jgi:hypothetical protein
MVSVSFINQVRRKFMTKEEAVAQKGAWTPTPTPSMHPIDKEDLESILHRLIVDIAKDKEVFYRMSTKQSFVELCGMMRHLFQYQPKKD